MTIETHLKQLIGDTAFQLCCVSAERDALRVENVELKTQLEQANAKKVKVDRRKRPVAGASVDSEGAERPAVGNGHAEPRG